MWCCILDLSQQLLRSVRSPSSGGCLKYSPWIFIFPMMSSAVCVCDPISSEFNLEHKQPAGRPSFTWIWSACGRQTVYRCFQTCVTFSLLQTSFSQTWITSRCTCWDCSDLRPETSETHSNRSRRRWIIFSNENNFCALLKSLPEDQSSNRWCVFSPQWRERRWKNRKHQADPEVPVLHEPALPGGVVQRRDVPRGGGAAAEQVVIQGFEW